MLTNSWFKVARLRFEWSRDSRRRFYRSALQDGVSIWVCWHTARLGLSKRLSSHQSELGLYDWPFPQWSVRLRVGWLFCECDRCRNCGRPEMLWHLADHRQPGYRSLWSRKPVISALTGNPRALAMRWFLVVKPPFERPKPCFRVPLRPPPNDGHGWQSIVWTRSPGMAPLSLSASTIVSHRPAGVRRLKRR